MKTTVNHLLSSLIFIFLPAMTMVNGQPLNISLEKSMAGVVNIVVVRVQDYLEIYGMTGLGVVENKKSMTNYSHYYDCPNNKPVATGFVIERNGVKYIITNVHVVENAHTEDGNIYVLSITGQKYRVSIYGGDTFYDLMVLKFLDTPGPETIPLWFRQVPAKIGEPVYAIGNPTGEFPYTVSNRVISNANRIMWFPDGHNDYLTVKGIGFLQSTAMLYGGNSGSPLVDTKGKIIGINTASFPQIPQINFALDGVLANRLIIEIITNKQKVRSYLGMEISQELEIITPQMLRSRTEKILKDSLPVISGIIPGSRASIALTPYIGSNLVRINNTATRSVEDVISELEKIRPGNFVKLELKHNDDSKIINIKSGILGPECSAQVIQHLFPKDHSVSFEQNNDKVYVNFRTDRPIEDEPFNSRYNDTFLTLTADSSYIDSNRHAYFPDDTMIDLSDNFNFDYPDEDDNQYYNMTRRKAGKYEMIAAGLHKYSGNDLWRINSVQDLAAALWICSLAGVLDICFATKGEKEYLPENERIHLSGNKDFLKRTLIY